MAEVLERDDFQGPFQPRPLCFPQLCVKLWKQLWKSSCDKNCLCVLVILVLPGANLHPGGSVSGFLAGRGLGAGWGASLLGLCMARDGRLSSAAGLARSSLSLAAASALDASALGSVFLLHEEGTLPHS